MNSLYFIIFWKRWFDLLPFKHPSEIGFLHAKILYYIGKGNAFNVWTIIQGKIMNQAHVINSRIGHFNGCLINQMILVTGVSLEKYSETTHCMGEIGRSKISKFSV